MSNTPESTGSTDSSYVTRGLSSEEIVQWLDDQPSYNGILKVFRGEVSGESLAQAVDGSTKFQIINGAEGAFGTIQGSENTADRSKRSDSFDYHTDGFFFETPPPLFSLVCEDPGTTDSRTAFVDTKEVFHKVEDYLPILGLLKFKYISKSLERYSRPLVEHHPIDGLPITNLVTRGYVEPEVDKDSLPTLPDFRFMNEAMSALYAAIDKSVVYTHSWQKGDALIADNHTYIHARLAAAPDMARRLSRLWLGHAVNLDLSQTD